MSEAQRVFAALQDPNLLQEASTASETQAGFVVAVIRRSGVPIPLSAGRDGHELEVVLRERGWRPETLRSGGVFRDSEYRVGFVLKVGSPFLGMTLETVRAGERGVRVEAETIRLLAPPG